MAIERWDEESINALFRQYQKTRDGVSFDRYQPIMEAAREMLERRPSETHDAETEHRMQLIRDSAKEMFLTPDRTEVIDWASSSDRRRSRGVATEWFDGLVHGLREFVDSLNPARWVPVAVTAALVAAVVPFVLDTKDEGTGGSLIATQIEVLQQNSRIISSELDALNSFQLGFSSSGSDFASAFGAGVLFVDLVSLSADESAARVADIESALVSVTADRIDLVAGVEQHDRIARTVELGDRLQNYYRQNAFSSVFTLGQWVESNYLLSKIAQKDGNSAALLQGLNDIDEIVASLTAGNHSSPMLVADFTALKQLADGEQINASAVKKISLTLLKMRSYLAGS